MGKEVVDTLLSVVPMALLDLDVGGEPVLYVAFL